MEGNADIRARVEEHWRASESGDIETEHAIYAADAILDYPQSGERFRGRDKIQAQRGGHPAERHFTVRRILGRGDLWVSECVISYDGVPTFSVSIMEFAGGFVTHETQYFADPFKAASWRAALAEPMPASEGEPARLRRRSLSGRRPRARRHWPRSARSRPAARAGSNAAAEPLNAHDPQHATVLRRRRSAPRSRSSAASRRTWRPRPHAPAGSSGRSRRGTRPPR